MFSANTYRERREHLRKRMDKGLLLSLGNHESPMNYADNTYHFRQYSSFLYFWGLDVAGLAAIIDLESGEETIFGNDLTVDDIVWTGTQPKIQEKAERVGVTRTEADISSRWNRTFTSSPNSSRCGKRTTNTPNSLTMKQ